VKTTDSTTNEPEKEKSEMNLCYTLIASIGLLAMLSACGGGNNNGTEDNSATTGTLTLSLTDAPIDQVYEVNVQFTGVSIKPQAGAALHFDFPAPVDIDLLSLQNGNAVSLLDGEPVDAGPYDWIELHTNADLDGVFDSYVMETENGGQIELRVPSGNVRLVSRFTVTAGQMNAFTIDWDVRKGLTDPIGQNGWSLRPAFRLIDRTEFGSLSGTVADALAMHTSCSSDAEGNGNLVYVFDGHDTLPDDLGSEGEPLTTAPVRIDETMAGSYAYTIPFLDPGQYTVAFTCQGLDDDPTIDEMDDQQILFAAQVNAEVAPGRDTKNQAPAIE
jgi:hypothetical protein